VRRWVVGGGTCFRPKMVMATLHLYSLCVYLLGCIAISSCPGCFDCITLETRVVLYEPLFTDGRTLSLLSLKRPSHSESILTASCPFPWLSLFFFKSSISPIQSKKMVLLLHKNDNDINKMCIRHQIGIRLVCFHFWLVALGAAMEFSKEPPEGGFLSRLRMPCARRILHRSFNDVQFVWREERSRRKKNNIPRRMRRNLFSLGSRAMVAASGCCQRIIFLNS